MAALCPLSVLQKKVFHSVALPLPYRTRATCSNPPPQMLQARQDSSLTIKYDPTQTSSLTVHHTNSQQDSTAATQSQSHRISLDLCSPPGPSPTKEHNTRETSLFTQPVKDNLHHSEGRTLSWLVQHRSGLADRSTDADGACNQCR